MQLDKYSRRRCYTKSFPDYKWSEGRIRLRTPIIVIAISFLITCGGTHFTAQEPPPRGLNRNLQEVSLIESGILRVNSTRQEFDASMSIIKHVKSSTIRSLLKKVIQGDNYSAERRKACLTLYLSQYVLPGMSLSELVADGVVELIWIKTHNAEAVSKLPARLTRSDIANEVRTGDQLLVRFQPDFLEGGETLPICLICSVTQYQFWRLSNEPMQNGNSTVRPMVTIKVITCEL